MANGADLCGCCRCRKKSDAGNGIEMKNVPSNEQDEVEQDEVEQDEVEQDEVDQNEVDQNEVDQNKVDQNDVNCCGLQPVNFSDQRKVSCVIYISVV